MVAAAEAAQMLTAIRNNLLVMEHSDATASERAMAEDRVHELRGLLAGKGLA